jgi:hypothetical protein
MESLPLKYLVLILVGVIVVSAVMSITTEFAGQAQFSGLELAKTLGMGFNSTNKNVCNSFQGCGWNETIGNCTCE